MISKKGFTFIEVLTVLMIASIIVLIVAFGTGGARSSARDSKREADMAAISSALERFRSDCGDYPSQSEFSAATSSQSLRGNGSTPSCSSSSVYSSDFPQEPDASRSYSYSVSANGLTYTLCASLESAPVPLPSTGSCASCGSASCNYVLTNP